MSIIFIIFIIIFIIRYFFKKTFKVLLIPEFLAAVYSYIRYYKLLQK